VSNQFTVDLDTSSLPVVRATSTIGNPTVIVDNVHVTYRVFGGRVGSTTADKPSLFTRAVQIGRPNSGPITHINAVQGVSLIAHQGESIGIIGANGSGKSTLLRAIAGVLPPSSGKVYVSGDPALLGVNAALIPALTGARNITLGGLAAGLSKREVEARTRSVADFAELGEYLQLPMSSYSSGMQSRLKFAISTISMPDILMIDEALATGDAAFQKKSLERIDEVRNNAGTVFFVSHSLQAVQKMCTRAIWLNQGRAVMVGDVDEVTAAYDEYIQGRGDAAIGSTQL
jgi:teichoic acid transport system ATP-binding protein